MASITFRPFSEENEHRKRKRTGNKKGRERINVISEAKVNRQREISQVNGRHIANNKNTHR
jgi:hypothetical protein